MSVTEAAKFIWSDEKIENLRTLAAAGASASKIATAIGTSRNSVVGKCHRLSPRITLKGMPSKPPAPPTKPKVKADRRQAKKLSQPMPAMTSIEPSPARSEFELARPPKVGAFEALPNSSPVKVVAHTKGCRWPIGEGPFHFCNLKVAKGSYCDAHASINNLPTPRLNVKGRKS